MLTENLGANKNAQSVAPRVSARRLCRWAYCGIATGTMVFTMVESSASKPS